MADPFTLATGIAGLISLSLEVTKIAQQYINGVRHSSKDIKDFLKELVALTDVLRQLDAFLKKDEAGERSFDQTSVLVKTYKACRNSLEKTRSALQSRVNECKLLQALTWPFVGKEHQQVISAIQRWIHTFQFALTIDGCVLLSKTAGEVSAILNYQLKTLDETKKIAHLVPSLLQSTEKATDSISEVLNAVSSLAEIQKSMASLGETVQNIERIALESLERESQVSKEQQVLQWLSTLNFRPKQLDTLRRRTPSTGKWLLAEENFRSWVDGSGSSCLFCSGIPGAGKTVLTSLVITHLESHIAAIKPIIAYIFFDYKDQERQTATAILCSLLRQVIESIGEIPQSIQYFYGARTPYEKENTMDEEQCISLLESLIRNEPRDTFLIFDALDECPDRDHDSNEVRSRITSAMKRLAVVGKLFITARPHVHPATVIPDCLRLDIRATDSDMHCYINTRIKEHKRLNRLVGSDPQLANLLNETLCRKANGMFLLTRLQMDSLVNQTSARHVFKALQSLPEKLSETFGDAIERIKSQSREYWQLARQVISWIFYAKRPLKVSELREMLAVEPEDTKFDPFGLHERDLILEVCCGLVSIDELDETIRLVHYSFQEYLTTCWYGHWPKAEETVAATCLASLTLEGCSIYETWSCRPVHPRFFGYACRYWSEHVKGPLEQILEDQILRVLETEMHLEYDYRIHERAYEVASRTTPLHVVASLGLDHLISVLVKRKIDLEARDSNGYTPLGRAVKTGERTAVLQLLERGADPNAQSGRETPLFIASAGKDLAMLELLLDNGAIYDARALIFSTIDLKCLLGSNTVDPTVLQWLLNKARFKDEDKFEALLYHVRDGRVDLVQILLRAGTNANRIDNESGDTALTTAIYYHQYDVLDCLLAAGAEPSIRSPRGDIPFNMAVSLRREPAIDALIAANADPNLLDMYGRSCLDLACPDEELLSKLGGELATYIPTNAVVKERRIREGIMGILCSFYTLWWRCKSDAVKQQARVFCMLGTLGHCLLLIGEFADARTCFENEPNTIYCDGCPGDRRIPGKRFVCGSCTDTDLCEPCMSLQKSQAPPLPSCKDHEFLEIAEPGLVKYGEDRVNDAGETFREWLTRLAQCYLNEDDFKQFRSELNGNNKRDEKLEEPETIETD
ncbi:hypothetical protein JMJ35_003555 [Cladonia borealis]|uniref:Ankyrin repeat protein n=1 Tax=Cladonia borealis TaxID=184061 RepID=A0AA39R5S2_9LECA|nr:hypothetical protein JMJ35_003555 [Cladonia borealis]